MKFLTYLYLATLVGLSSAALAMDKKKPEALYNQALEFESQGNLAKAGKIFNQLANNNISNLTIKAKAQYKMGCYWRDGKYWGLQELPKDRLETAITWFKQAEKNGYKEAEILKPSNSLHSTTQQTKQRELTFFEYVTIAQKADQNKNYNKAFEFFKAAEKINKEHPEVQFYLAGYYAEGKGSIEKNEKLALKHLKNAAAQNYPPALFHLGIFYYEGKGGLAMNLDRALDYFLKAEQLGDMDAKEVLTDLSSPINVLTSLLIEEKRTEPEKLTRPSKTEEKKLPNQPIDSKMPFLIAAAKSGEKRIVVELLYAEANKDILYQGKTAEQWARDNMHISLAEFIKNFKLPQEAQCSGKNLYELTIKFYNNYQANTSQAFMLISEAQQQGYQEAKTMLEFLRKLIQAEQEAEKKNFKQAFALFQQAEKINNNDPRLHYQLASYYSLKIEGAQKDDYKARLYLEKAAAENFPQALGALGLFYSEGRGGLPEDYNKAIECFLKGEQRGDQYSIKFLYVLNQDPLTAELIKKKREELSKQK